MGRKEIIIKHEKDKNIEKKILSFDYFKSKDKENTRFKLFNYLMKERNTILHINTNMTVSMKPSEDRDMVLKFRDMCEKDNIDFILNPASRDNRGGFLGKILSRDENRIPAYNILIYLPAGTFNKDIFKKYMCTYFFRAGIGFENESFSRIRSDYESGLLTDNNFYRTFDYDVFDAFEFNHIKIISDMIVIKDLENIFQQ